jgi:cation diffusion facilitator CzcD-associated flavoprotein CzcO
MSENQTTMAPQAEGQAPEFDAIVVGAGFSGLYMLHSLRKQGLSVRVYEQGGGVGGTWYWNRYPGARCDSESVYYMFTDHMSEEILSEWDWSERYAAQPEILRYLEFVTDKMDLRRDIQFNARVVSAVYDPGRNRWDVRLADGGAASARFLVTAVGCLSSTNTPKFPGLDTFAGESYHTGAWPHEGVDFAGKRVAVIGTGATAVQAVPEIAKQAAHVWVFQRTPNYDIPGRNRPLEPDYAAGVRADYKDLWQKARESGFGLPYQIVEWREGPRTYLGLTTRGFPNLFVITGPQSPSVLSNMPVAIEQNVEWIAGLVQYLTAHGLDTAEPAQEAEDKWVEHHNEVAAATLLLGTDSWWVGANIPGKPRTLYPYVGGVGPFRTICQEAADKGYEGLVLTRHG